MQAEVEHTIDVSSHQEIISWPKRLAKDLLNTTNHEKKRTWIQILTINMVIYFYLENQS